MNSLTHRFARALAWGGAVIFAAGSVANGEDVDGTGFFEAKIRPLLAERCYECHGEKKQKGGLRLDSRAGWQKGGDDGAVITPGDPGASMLMKAVRYADKDVQMPPKRQLSQSEIDALEEWIKLGAPDPRAGTAAAAQAGIDFAEGRKYWAFRPVSDSPPPYLEADTWSRNELDRFVLARLRKAGIAPSPAADRRTLIRRATFDLIGLPPTEEEVAAFERDAAPDAFEKVVERLLASPHYGEHWARHWLDVARYSDTKGYVYGREERQFVHAWPYRDWVVRAFNDDMAYDRFLLLQIAADQVSPAESPNLAAMGFLTLGRRFLGVTHDIFDDRIDVLMRGTQALTVGCARCHDHKFDPISSRDYYALYGVFQSCAEQMVPCGAAPHADAAFEKELEARREELRKALSQHREEQAARVRAAVKEYVLAQLELEKYPEETFSQILSSEDINPLFVRRWHNFLAEACRGGDRNFTAWHAFSELRPAEFAHRADEVTTDLKERPPEALNPLVAKVFATPPKDMREVAERYGALLKGVDRQWRELIAREPDAKALPDADAEALRRVLYGRDSPCLVPNEDLVNIEWYFPTDVTVKLWKLQGEVDRCILQPASGPAYATILVDRAKPVSPRVFKRGNPLTRGEEVPRRFLQVLAGDEAPPFAKGSGRLELAQAIISPRNPLTARVMVNRVWMCHFGRGIVGTPSDFGKRAEPPSHPELLDWLARRFMEGGWSLKDLHRRILLSATYRQSSLGPADLAAAAKAREADSDNRLLWRMNTHRLTFEEMRDTSLAASGELDLRLSGKGSELFANQNFRRTLYTTIDRERLPSIMRIFDFANPDLSIPQRNDTIVPQQALFGLNHPFLAARARSVARRSEGTGSHDKAERVRHLYLLLYQRPPNPAEIESALAFLAAADGGIGPEHNPPNGPSSPPPEFLTPWEQLAQVLMLANEFVFID